MDQKTETYELPEGLMDAITRVLSQLPYAQVHGLMGGLAQARQVEKPTEGTGKK